MILNFTFDPLARLEEIQGLTKLEIEMYDLAWDAWRSGSLTAMTMDSLIDVWAQKVSVNMSLKNVLRVRQRLLDHGFYHSYPYSEWRIDCCRLAHEYEKEYKK